MSFLKFKNEQNLSTDRGKVHWGRAELDGAPYRGKTVPFLKEEEFQEKAELVYDCKVGVFRTDKPDLRRHGRTYQEVLDGIAADWFRLTAPRKFHWTEPTDGEDPVMFVYVEWAETFKELPQKYHGAS